MSRRQDKEENVMKENKTTGVSGLGALILLASLAGVICMAIFAIQQIGEEAAIIREEVQEVSEEETITSEEKTAALMSEITAEMEEAMLAQSKEKMPIEAFAETESVKTMPLIGRGK